MPQGFNLTDFKGRFSLEGARPTLFEAKVFGLPFADSRNDFTFHCKAAQLPGKTLGVVEVPYFGRKIKVHGDQTFAEWTVTVINEENFRVRNGFELWMSTINQHVQNTKVDLGYKAPLAFVTQYSKQGAVVKEYKFVGMFPTDISPIDVSWESNDTIEEFTVTLQYDWWESAGVSDFS
jgi:hypothetical protein